jgi:hypothetical protein
MRSSTPGAEDLVTGNVTDIWRSVHPNAGYAGILLRSRAVAVDGINRFSWATQYVRLNRETGEVRGVTDRAPDEGFASQGASSHRERSGKGVLDRGRRRW